MQEEFNYVTNMPKKKLEGNGPVEPAASRAIEDKHMVQ